MRGNSNLAVQKDDIQTITKLGLTLAQATVYCSLLQSGKATAKLIAKNSNTARQEVYRVLNELHEKGLIEKLLSIPTEYKALPIEEGINLLIDRQKKRICEIEKQATKLLKNLKEEQKNALPAEAQFILLPEKGKYIGRTLKLIMKSSTKLDALTTFERFRALTPFFYEELKKALGRGVKVRLLVRKPVKEQPQLNIPKSLRQTPLFNLRLGNEPSDIILSIVDNKEANIVTSERKNLDESTTLWTNNQAIIRIIQSYFDTLWETSTTINQQEK